MPIPALPLFKHRDTVVTPADQNQFVTQFETTMDTMSNDVIPAINLAITDINGKVITATTARDEAEDSRDIAVAAKNEALTAVATLQAGAIDDTTIAPNKAFSNQYIENNYYDKTEVNNKTNINGFTNKPTPIDTDNTVIQETDGTLKKLSWDNLKATLLTYFDTFYSRKTAIFGIGQTWQNMTASRSAGVEYTNSTGKPIEVSINIMTAASSGYSFLVGGSLMFGGHTSSATGTLSLPLNIVIPDNKTYKLDVGSSFAVLTWSELR